MTQQTMALQLRPLDKTDHKWVKSTYQNHSVMRHIGAPLSDDKVSTMFTNMLTEMDAQKAVYQIIEDSNSQEIVGLLSMHWRPEDAVVESGMIVLPRYQNRGVCKWAQLQAMKMIKNQFPAKLCTVYISADNVAAITSYKNMGFVVVNHQPKSKHQLNRLDFKME